MVQIVEDEELLAQLRQATPEPLSDEERLEVLTLITRQRDWESMANSGL